MKKTFSTKILLTNVLTSIAVFACILAAAGYNIQSRSEKSFVNEASEYSKIISHQISLSLENLKNLTSVCSQDLSRINPRAYNARFLAEDMVKSLLAEHNDIYRTWVIFEPNAFDGRDAQYESDQNPSGRFMRSYISSGGQTKEVFDIRDNGLGVAMLPRSYTLPLSTGEIYWQASSSYDYNELGGEKLVGTIAVPIFRDGHTIGCVGADILYDEMCSVIDGMNVIDRRNVVLFSSDGVVVYSSNKENIGKSTRQLGFSEFREINDKIGMGEKYLEKDYSPFSNDMSLMSIFPINTNGVFMSVYVDIPTSIVDGEARASLIPTVIVAFWGFLIAQVILYFLVQSITRPIHTITAITERVADRDYSRQIKFKRKRSDEIGVLADTVNKMISEIKNNAAEMERKVGQRTSELLFMTKQAEAAADAKMQFLASMSHELRTPMNAVIGMSELLLAEELTEKQQHLVNDIKISSAVLLEIINDILDISKIESGKLKLSLVDYDFPLLIERTSSLMAYAVKSKGIKFITDIPDDLPRCLYGDDIRMQQILVNVIGNAIKFTKKGYVKLKISVEQRKIIFTIEDTGIGIPDAEKSKLFNVFEQAESSSHRNIKGTGLGLSITRSLLDMMDGTIDFDSEYGKGTTFTITIPKVIGNADAIAKADDAFEYISVKDAEVLVVDDNEINLDVAAGLLGLCDIICETVLSGAEAIERIKQKEYDIVFLDHMMPEMDGIDVIKILREMGYKKPVIALSANAVAGAREMFLDSGMNDFLSKPIERNLLNQMLMKWLPKDKIVKEGVMSESNKPREGSASVSNYTSKILAASKISGLIVDHGLKRMQGLSDAYERCLKILARRTPDVTRKVALYLADNKIRDYTIEVHGMKSSLAEVGALDLSKMAAALEEAANSGNMAFCVEHTATFVEGLSKLGDKLNKIFGESQSEEGSAGAKPIGEASRLEESLKKIYTALDDFLGDEAIEELKQIMMFSYGNEIDAILQQILNATEEFDYLKGMNLISEITKVNADETTV